MILLTKRQAETAQIPINETLTLWNQGKTASQAFLLPHPSLSGCRIPELNHT